MITLGGHGRLAPFQPGDRIRLVAMPDDPDPIPAGAEGTVEECLRWSSEEWGVHVRWDSGRTLSLCVPPDQAVKVS